MSMMKKLLALAFLLLAYPALAQNPTCPTRPVGDSTNACASTAFVQGAVTNAVGSLNQRSVTAAGDSLQTTDCGASVIFTGATFYSFTVSAATGFSATCRVVFRNGDPQTGTTGAKILAITGAQMRCSGGAASSIYIWPQQTMAIVRVGSTWMVECPGLWQAPQGTIVINFDPVNGSDTFGAADGLATGVRAFGTGQNALNIVSEMMRANFFSQTIFSVKCTIAGASCSGTTDNATGLHFPSHGNPVGSQGRAGLTLDCNGLTFGSSSSFSLFFPGSIIEVQNCTFATTVALTEGSELILDTGNSFTPVTGGANIFCSGQSKLITNGQNININAGTGQFFINMSSCAASLPVATLLGNVTYTGATVNIQASGYLSPFSVWTLGAFTVTGTKYNLIECGILEGSANVPGTVAGSASCTQAN